MSFLYTRPRREYGPGQATLIMTGLLSLGFYGGSALALFQSCLGRFEREVDRPRRELPDYLENVSSEGIVFDEQQQDQTDQDGIRFLDPADDEEVGGGDSPDNVLTPENPDSIH